MPRGMGVLTRSRLPQCLLAMAGGLQQGAYQNHQQCACYTCHGNLLAMTGTTRESSLRATRNKLV